MELIIKLSKIFMASLIVVIVGCADSDELTTSSPSTFDPSSLNGDGYYYDIAWAKEELEYKGDYAYLDFAEFNSFNLERYTYMDSLPIVYSEDCTKEYKNSDELLGYKSDDLCVCEILDDTQYYYDISKAIKGIDKDWSFDYIYYPQGNNSEYALAFKDSLFYEAISTGKVIIPIPSCYRDLKFVGMHNFSDHQSEVLKKTVRNGERNMNLELFVSEGEECYYISLRLDGVSAYGYISY